MQLDKKRFALTAAWTMGIVYVVCAVFVYVFPDLSSRLMSWLTHIVNLEPRQVTLGSFAGGLIQVLVYTYLAALLFAWLHNRSENTR